MKKIFLIALAVAVLFSLPLAAQAKVDFELGGYIRMDALWTSQQSTSYAFTSYPVRGNALGADHGKFLMNANASRFNFTMKGPELWGGKVTGFIECDFDGGDTINQGRAANGAFSSYTATNDSSFNQAKLRLRHAMFKINWSEQELLFGQYWSVNSELIPETADSGAYAMYGATQLRIPQVRYTQKFGNGFDASLAICSPQSGRWGLNVDANNPQEGETSEQPMVEAKLRFEQDLYGKAGWYGKPRAFYVGLGAGYFRSRNQALTLSNTASNTYLNTGAATPAGNRLISSATSFTNWGTLGTNNFFTPTSALAFPGGVNPGIAARPVFTINTASTFNTAANYQDHWLFLIENFTPIIPTVTKNLAGSLGLAHQWWIGQGVSAWRLDLPGNSLAYNWSGLGAAATSAFTGTSNQSTNSAAFNYNLALMKRYGGWLQLQYYWTEPIYTNINFGFSKAFGFNGARNNVTPGGFFYANPVGYDPINSMWQAGVTQWYRPVAAVKFALQYTYQRVNYFQISTVGTNTSNVGQNHLLMANAWYMF